MFWEGDTEEEGLSHPYTASTSAPFNLFHPRPLISIFIPLILISLSPYPSVPSRFSLVLHRAESITQAVV